jgi:hypothetical protein
MPFEASPLLVSWMTVNSWPPSAHEHVRAVVERARSIRNEVEADASTAALLDSLVSFAGWRSDRRPFLVPTSLAEATALMPKDSPIRSTIALHAVELDKVSATWAAAQAHRRRERDRWEIALEALAQRRHQIVHEAMVTEADMALYARRLEHAFESILRRLADVVLAAASTARTVADATAWHRAPWE